MAIETDPVETNARGIYMTHWLLATYTIWVLAKYLYSRSNDKKSVDEYVDENWGVDNSLPYRMGKRLVSLKRKFVG